jgi:hypothetical protein
MRNLKSIKLLAVAVTAFSSLGVSVPTASAEGTAFEECLHTYCFGQYPGDPVGYRQCWVWCANSTGGPQ